MACPLNDVNRDRILNIPTTFVGLSKGTHFSWWRLTILAIWRCRVVVAIRKSTIRVIASLPGSMAVTRARCHLESAVSSYKLCISTRSPVTTGFCCCLHFWRDCNDLDSPLTTLAKSVATSDWSEARDFLEERWLWWHLPQVLKKMNVEWENEMLIKTQGQMDHQWEQLMVLS